MGGLKEPGGEVNWETANARLDRQGRRLIWILIVGLIAFAAVKTFDASHRAQSFSCSVMERLAECPSPSK